MKIADDTRRDHLGRLPLEVIEMILKGLDDVECACIGVTSRVFYTTYKRLHKNATKLDAPYMGKTAGRPIMLYVFLQDWVGDGYRIFRKYSESGPPRLVFKKLTVLPVLKDDRPSLPVAETSLVAATKFLQRREGSEQNDPIAPRVHV